MSNPIKSSDLFIDDGSLQVFIDKAKELQAAVETLKKEAAKLEAQIRKNNSTTTTQSTGLKKSASRTNELKRAYDNYNKSIARNATNIQIIKAATREQNQLNKQSARLTTNVATSYNALSAQYSRNKIRLNAMSVAQRENTREGRILLKQTNKIYTEMKRLQAQTGKNTLNVGNYKSAVNGLWKSFKNLAAVYLSFTGVQTLFTSIFGTTKELDALNLSYRQVITSTVELAQTQEFLRDVSDRLGIGIIDISKSYLKFRAAAGSTNLSVKQTQKIFESFSKASAILSLSGDDTRGVFKALEQMISKGKVSSEELRLQLGERLPGAFAIMARSLDRSVKELDEMLKKGEVLSEDALPKFAKEVEKAFGVQNLERIETLVAAQGRFASSWTYLVEELDAAGVFSNVIDFFRNFIDLIKFGLPFIINLGKAVGIAAVSFATYRTGILLAATAERISKNATIANAISKGTLTTATRLATISVHKFTKALKANPYTFVATAIIGIVTSIIAFNKEAETTLDILEDINDKSTDATRSEKVEAARLTDILKDENATRDQKRVALNKLQSINQKYFGQLDLEKSKIEDIEAAQDSYNESILGRERLTLLKKELSDIDKELDEIDIKIKDTTSLKDKKQGGIIRGGTISTKKSILEEQNRRKEILKIRKQTTQDIINELEYREEQSQKFGGNGKVETEEEKEKRLKKEAAAKRAAKRARDKAQNERFAEQKRRIDEMEDGLDKELALLKLSLDKKLYIYKESEEDTEALINYYNNRKKDIQDKYIKEEQIKILDAEKEKLSLMEDGEKKEILLIENAKKRKLLDNKNQVLIEEEAARKIAAVKSKYFDKEQKERERITNIFKDIEQEEFDLEEAKAKAKFLSVKRNQDERDAYELLATKRRLKKQLELELFYNKNLTDLEKLQIKNKLKILKGEIASSRDSQGDSGKPIKSIYDLLGINVSDEEEDAINKSVTFALKQISDVQQAKVDAANQNVQTANQEVATAQRTLNQEIANRNAGFANSVDTAQMEFDLAKKNQERALKERRKAVQDQQRLDAITQTSSLITAASGIWRNIGTTNPLLALASIALMFGSFAAAKIKANNITKKTLGKGGYETIGGGSHASGNDTFVGSNSQGEQVYAERGETMGVFKRKSVRRYGNRIKDLVNSINAGTLDNHLGTLNQASEGIPLFNLSNSNNTDMSRTESELRKIRIQGEIKNGIDSNGRRFTQKKNVLTTYIQ